MDSVPRYEFHKVFRRVSYAINLKGALTPEQVDRRLARAKALGEHVESLVWFFFPDVVGALTPAVAASLVNTAVAFQPVKIPAPAHTLLTPTLLGGHASRRFSSKSSTVDVFWIARASAKLCYSCTLK